MKIAVIADDLTGANDTGVQLAKCGLSTFVSLKPEAPAPKEAEALVIDTDSRSLPQAVAYDRVLKAAKQLSSSSIEMIYKKMDSTMRGNIGAEIDAMYDAFAPDFVIIAPSFPKLGRGVINGTMYVHGQLLHMTEVAVDPKTPVNESFLPLLLTSQTTREVGHISVDDLSSEAEKVVEKIHEFRQDGIPYLLFDAVTEEDLAQIVHVVSLTGYRVVWAGSAGLASHLPLGQPQTELGTITNGSVRKPVLTVVGSVHGRSRKQLNAVIAQEEIAEIGLNPERVLANEEDREQEIVRVTVEAALILAQGKHVVLYSLGEEMDIMRAVQQGERYGYNRNEVSNKIAEALGEASVRIIRQHGIERLMLTGGDTAKQVCLRLNASHLRLIDEIEAGVPIGALNGTKIFTVTKAGGFGSEDALVKAIAKLERGRL